MTPRCGRPLRRCEAANGAQPERPRCGRPAGHNGPHRSVQSLERMRAGDRARNARWKRSRRLHARLAAVVQAAAAQARERARAA